MSKLPTPQPPKAPSILPKQQLGDPYSPMDRWLTQDIMEEPFTTFSIEQTSTTTSKSSTNANSSRLNGKLSLMFDP